MFGKVARAVSLLLFAWFVFMIGAVIYAATRRREVSPQDPAADEIDLVATFGPLEFHSESGAFKGGTVTTWFGVARSTCVMPRWTRTAQRSRPVPCSAAAT